MRSENFIHKIDFNFPIALTRVERNVGEVGWNFGNLNVKFILKFKKIKNPKKYKNLFVYIVDKCSKIDFSCISGLKIEIQTLILFY